MLNSDNERVKRVLRDSLLRFKVLERHVTLDKSWKGSDHAASLNPQELKQLVDGIRQVEAALGKPLKAIRASEEACRGKLGKSLVATKNLKAGDVLDESVLVVKVRRMRVLLYL